MICHQSAQSIYRSSEIGYNIFLHGSVWDDGAAKNDEESDFSVAVSETQMMKLRLRIGDVIRGTAWTEMYPQYEYADYYRAEELKAP